MQHEVVRDAARWPCLAMEPAGRDDEHHSEGSRVLAGMGVSVLPDVAVASDIAAGRLTRLAWSEPFDVATQMVWNARRSISPAQAAFMTTAREVLRPT